MKWPAVVTVCAVVAGLVATMWLGQLQGDQVVKIWAAVLAMIAALWRPAVKRVRESERPPPPADRLWPLGVFGTPDLVGAALDAFYSAQPLG